MIVKIRNPSFDPAARQTAAVKTAITAHFAANVGVENFTFDDLRAARPALAALTDGQLHQALLDMGVAVSVG